MKSVNVIIISKCILQLIETTDSHTPVGLEPRFSRFKGKYLPLGRGLVITVVGSPLSGERAGKCAKETAVMVPS